MDPNHRRSRHFPDEEIGNKKKHWRHLKFECFVTSEWKSKLYFWTGTRNSKTWAVDFTKYHKDLSENHKDIRRRKITYNFDLAPSHKSKASKQFYNELGIRYELFGNKPVEINACERVWGRIKQYAWSKNPQTLKDAKRYLKREYRRITREDLRKYFKEIPQRLKEISNCAGGKTRYWSNERR